MDESAVNREQIEYWNAAAGETWAGLHDRLDRQLQGLGQAALEALAPAPGERVLDLGCGCGHTTLALARAVGEGGHVTGVDISRPMLEVARQRVPEALQGRVEFLEADVQSHAFEAAAFDAAYSRFGVMFFSDPVAAFRNVAAAMKPAGRLAFVCWRSLGENAWMSVPRSAGLQHLPAPPPVDPAAPGPFAFADARRVESLLEAAGWSAVDLAPFDTSVLLGRDLEEAVGTALRVGPLGAMLRECPDQLGPVSRTVREALGPYLGADGVLMPAAAWIVRAVAGR